MNRTQLRALLTKHEGVRLKPYHDMVGKITIGVGRNLDDVGISADEAAVLLDNDINRLWHELPSAVACFTALDDVRQNVLIDLAFNIGVAGLLKFKLMLSAVEARDFDKAADEM